MNWTGGQHGIIKLTDNLVPNRGMYVRTWIWKPEPDRVVQNGKLLVSLGMIVLWESISGSQDGA